jgi:hypothetical protein
MFRIPRKNPKGTILLQHPLSVNSRIYVSRRNESLGNNFETVLSTLFRHSSIKNVFSTVSNREIQS